MAKIRVAFRPYHKIKESIVPIRAISPLTYKAFSEFSEYIYPLIIAACPVEERSEDPRRKPGFVRRHIKLMWTSGPEGIRVRTVGVPGGSVKGSSAYHALMAIYSLEKGWARGVTYRPRTKQAMTFPLRKGETFRNPRTAAPPPGGRGPATWVITKRVTHLPGQYTVRNPFVSSTFKKHLNELKRLIARIRREYRKGRTRVVRG